MRRKDGKHQSIATRGRRALAFLLSFVMVTSGVPMQALAEVGDATPNDVATQTVGESAAGQAAEQLDSNTGTPDEGQESAATQPEEVTEGSLP